MGVMPAYGFFIRHAANIQLQGIQLRFMGKETRPALYLEDVKEMTLQRVNAQPVESIPLMVINDVSNLSIKDCNTIKDQFIRSVSNKKF
jgi:hypothetical protein